MANIMQHEVPSSNDNTLSTPVAENTDTLIFSDEYGATPIPMLTNQPAVEPANDELSFLDPIMNDDNGRLADAKDESLKELHVYADIAKFLVSQTIRDLCSSSRQESRDARRWITADGNQKPSEISLVTFESCCDVINIQMRMLGYDCEITPTVLRKKILESSVSEKKQIIIALETKTSSDRAGGYFKTDCDLVSMFSDESYHGFKDFRYCSTIEDDDLDLITTSVNPIEFLHEQYD